MAKADPKWNKYDCNKCKGPIIMAGIVLYDKTYVEEVLNFNNLFILSPTNVIIPYVSSVLFRAKVGF